MKEVAHRVKPRGSSLEQLIERSNIPCELIFASGDKRCFGAGPPNFSVTLHNDKLLNTRLNEFTLGKAYVEGGFDIEGDMLSVMNFRDLLKHQTELSMRVRFLSFLFLRSSAYVNKWAISTHYNFGDDFYLKFIDNRYRFYSQCLFNSDDETLEQAAEHKLESMYSALQLKPGMRLLDIGAGWGGVHEYCGPRGVHVTSVTLTEDSFDYTNNLIERMGLENSSVRIEDFLLHKPEQPYDAVVIYGVIEHIPYYRQFCKKLWECLKPGGLFYLDAAANHEKYDVSDFARTYIWQGTHTFLNLQEFIQELLFHGMEVIDVKRETRDYELTIKHWALRFDAQKEKIIDGWSEEIYKAFRMYLWAGCHCFHVNRLQAYSLVARRHGLPGPRPSAFKRFYNFLRSLV
jgi:cyclopropane-fatty-acyl-phospholipid synthase